MYDTGIRIRPIPPWMKMASSVELVVGGGGERGGAAA